MESASDADTVPPLHHPPRHRPPPTALPIGSSSDDSISTVATDSSADTLHLSYPHLAAHPYSSLVYTPPVREKDQFIDDEAILAKRFDGLGITEREELEQSEKRRNGEPADEKSEMQGGGGARNSGPASFASFAFPPTAAPLRHTSLPAIVTSAAQFAGLSASSPIEHSPAPVLPLFPTSAALLTGSAISSTPDASPGQSPVLSSSPFALASAVEPPIARISLPPRHQPLHHRSATTSSGSSSSISPRTSMAQPSTYHGMSRSGSTPNAAFPSSGSSTSSSFLQSPIARSASYIPPWAIAAGGGGGQRPGSAGTTSTNGTSSSSRPWVFDSDASSVCSANSAGWSSGGGGGGSVGSSAPAATKPQFGTRERRVTEDGEEFELDEGGEVFKPESDVEFLDHRPEPPGAKLSINRDDPHQVVLKVTLPGFSLDNITVAMRRGHKVHIVADSYGESGGHFEKLVHLGSDVSSVAPRAEFNGTDLNVYIQRRPSRPSSSASTAGGSTAALPPFGTTFPGSPTSTFSSPELDFHRRTSSSITSSFSSAWSLSDAAGAAMTSAPRLSRDSISLASTAPLSPSLEYPSPTDSSSSSSMAPFDDGRRRSQQQEHERDDPDMPPPFTVVAPPLSSIEAESRRHRSKCLTGPEGAKAAAKAAREEAARRAKEEAKKLPSSARGGRRLPFRRQKEDGLSDSGAISSSSGSAGEGNIRVDGGGNSSAGEASSFAGDVGTDRKGLSSHVAESIAPGQVSETRRGSASIDRNGTIKANSRATSPLPLAAAAAEPASSPSCCSSSTSRSCSPPRSRTSTRASSPSSSIVSSPTNSPPRVEPRPLPLFTNPSNPHHTHPRPKLREGNLTLRAPDGVSFVAQAQHQWTKAHHDSSSSRVHTAATNNNNSSVGSSGNESEVEGEGESLTPRWEHQGMKFAQQQQTPS